MQILENRTVQYKDNVSRLQHSTGRIEWKWLQNQTRGHREKFC